MKKTNRNVSTQKIEKLYASLLKKHAKADTLLKVLQETTASMVTNYDQIAKLKATKCKIKKKLAELDTIIAARAAPPTIDEDTMTAIVVAMPSTPTATSLAA